MNDYTEWMDGPGGYREWYQANYGSGGGATSGDIGDGTGEGDDSGGNTPPPPPPKK